MHKYRYHTPLVRAHHSGSLRAPSMTQEDASLETKLSTNELHGKTSDLPPSSTPQPASDGEVIPGAKAWKGNETHVLPNNRLAIVRTDTHKPRHSPHRALVLD